MKYLNSVLEHKYSKELVEALKNPFNWQIFLDNSPVSRETLAQLTLLERRFRKKSFIDFKIEAEKFFTNDIDEAIEKNKYLTEGAFNNNLIFGKNLESLSKVIKPEVFYFKLMFANDSRFFEGYLEILKKLLKNRKDFHLVKDFEDYLHNTTDSIRYFLNRVYPKIKREIEDDDIKSRLLSVCFNLINFEKDSKKASKEYLLVKRELEKLELEDADFVYLMSKIIERKLANRFKEDFLEDLKTLDFSKGYAQDDFYMLDLLMDYFLDVIDNVDEIVLSKDESFIISYFFTLENRFFEKIKFFDKSLSMTDLLSSSIPLINVVNEKLLNSRLKLFLARGGGKFTNSALEDIVSISSSLNSIEEAFKNLPSFYLLQIIKEDPRLVQSVASFRPDIARILLQRKNR